MKKVLILSLLSVFLLAPLAIADPADPGKPDPYAGEQETYLVQKLLVPGPWLTVPPEPTEMDVAFGKLEYFNYDAGDGFCFDFKAWDVAGDPNFVASYDGGYALIYYKDPADTVGPADVYVLGLSDGPYVPKDNPGKKKGLEEPHPIDFQISGCCADAPAIPADDTVPAGTAYADVNYPNGGRVWLVPTSYLTFDDGPDTCEWAQMTGWPDYGTGILFETSLITYDYSAAVTRPYEGVTLTSGQWSGAKCASGYKVFSCRALDGAPSNEADPVSVAEKVLWRPGASVDGVEHPSTPAPYFGPVWSASSEGCLVQNDNAPKTIFIHLICVKEIP